MKVLQLLIISVLILLVAVFMQSALDEDAPAMEYLLESPLVPIGLRNTPVAGSMRRRRGSPPAPTPPRTGPAGPKGARR